MLELEVVLELTVGGVVVGEDASHREEEVDRAAARVTQSWAAEGDAAECEPGGGDESVRIEHTGEDDVQEKALDSVLAGGEVTMVEVRRDDAGVVCAVPRSRRRLSDEGRQRVNASAARRNRDRLPVGSS